MKHVLYVVMLHCYFCCGVIEGVNKEWKAMILAFGFGVLNAVIFLWR